MTVTQTGPSVHVAGRWWQLPARHDVPDDVLAEVAQLRAATAKAVRGGVADHEMPGGTAALTPAVFLRRLIGGQADEMLAAGASRAELKRVARDFLEYVERGGGPLAPSRHERRRARGRT